MEKFDLTPIETLMSDSINKLNLLLSKMESEFKDKEKEYIDKIDSLESEIFDLNEKLNEEYSMRH